MQISGAIAMRRFRQLAMVTVLVCLFYLMFPRTVYAYIDLGTGSLIIQLLIGALLGASYVLRSYWGRVKAFFVKIFHKDKSVTKGDD
jgi:hypothetical protein